MLDRALIREAEAILAKQRPRRKIPPKDSVVGQLLAQIDNELSKWSPADLSGDAWPNTAQPTASQRRASLDRQHERQDELPSAAESEASDEMVTHEMVLAAGLKLWQVVPRLREEREARGLTMRDMYEATGMTSGRLSRLENQIETNPTIGTLERLAAALGVRLLVTLVEAADKP